MQRIALSIIMWFILLFGSIGCSTEKSIPDDELADIFHDVYLTNAYLNSFPKDLDSMAIYEPILHHYGYTVNDFTNTIGSFSRRKSAQLGSVLQKAEQKLLQRTKELERDVVILDTIRDVAVRSYRRMIRSDSLIEATKLADTQKLQLSIKPIYPGNYTVKFSYENKEKAGTRPLQGSMYLMNIHEMRRSNYTYNLRDKDFIRRNFVTDSSHTELIINLRIRPEETRKKGEKRRRKVAPNIEIRNLSIEYIPSDEVAIDSLMRRWVDIKIFNDEFILTAQDSVALGSDSLRVD